MLAADLLSPEALRGLGRSQFRAGRFPSIAEAAIALGRMLTAAEAKDLRDGWAAERAEVSL